MMRVELTQKYKSLMTDINVILPDFTVISGINGAGKSHLLSAIESGTAKVYDENGVEMTPRRYVTSNSLTPNDSYQVNRESSLTDVNNVYNAIQGHVQTLKTNPEANIYQTQAGFYNLNFPVVLDRILVDSGKKIEELTLEDISDNFPLNFGVGNDVFAQSFSMIFKRYMDRYEDNFYYEYLKERKGINKRCLSEEQFFKKHGTPPWQFVNRIFEESQLDYRINNPIENNRDMPFLLKLINKTSGAQVNFTDLSSGEKVLMSLTLALYNSKQALKFPKLLMLDEPDAPLHPSMAKQLLRVIEEVFVKENGVKVIMTTHSPSTIAMAPDDSLFVMQKIEPRIVSRSKEQIMKLLTDGIPSLSIYADNTRQVFVESAVDAAFYTKLYIKLKKIIQSDKSLNFLSSGVAKGNTGNCEQVKEIVKLLTDNGNQTVYGIIDWDMKNSNDNKVHVLGWGQRYSIENYIFDQIILANFLIREVILPKEYFRLEESETSFEFINFTKEKLQTIVDKVIDDISKNITSTTNDIVLVNYLGKNNDGLSLSIPKWYLHYHGHSLEDAIKKTYPQLNKFSKLKQEVVDKVIGDLPAFISLDFQILFQNLHN